MKEKKRNQSSDEEARNNSKKSTEWIPEIPMYPKIRKCHIRNQ